MDGTSKGLLGAFAVFTLGSGIASLAYGVLLLLRYLPIEFNYGIFNLFATSIVLIVVGSLLIIAVLLGIFGAFKDISNFRLVTLVLLLLLFIVLAAVGVWTMVSFKTGQLQTSIDNEVKRLHDTRNVLNAKDLKKAVFLSQHYNCCGLGVDTNANDAGTPDSCCVVPNCGSNPVENAPKYFEKSCGVIYYETKSVAVFHLAILSLGAAGGTLIGLILYALIFQRARAGYDIVPRT